MKGKNNVIYPPFKKMSAWQTRAFGHTRGGIRCLEGVSILCWPVTPAVNSLNRVNGAIRCQNQCIKKDIRLINVNKILHKYKNDNYIIGKCCGPFENLWINLWFLITIRRLGLPQQFSFEGYGGKINLFGIFFSNIHEHYII